MPMSEGQGPKHTFWVGPWYYCGVCYWKTHIKDMTWQRGVLRCPSCTERSPDGFPLVGQREVAIEERLQDGRSEREFTPVEKLRDPSQFEEAEDFVL